MEKKLFKNNTLLYAFYSKVPAFSRRENKNFLLFKLYFKPYSLNNIFLKKILFCTTYLRNARNVTISFTFYGDSADRKLKLKFLQVCLFSVIMQMVSIREKKPRAECIIYLPNWNIGGSKENTYIQRF